jgi:hypothetical protein
MTEPGSNTAETREFELPIRLTIGEREIEVPITVAVTFDELTRMVERHLSEQEDIYAQLMEHYADQASRKRGKRHAEAAPPRAEAAGKPDQNGSAKNSRKKTPAAPEMFEEEELARWRGQPEPPLGPRGRKTRERLLWEAANPAS